MLHEHFRLSSPNLEGDGAAGQEMLAGLVQEGADDDGAVRAAIEGGERVAPDLPGEGGDFPGRDVGEVRDDEGVPAGNGGEEIALEEADAVREAEPGRILGGKGERIRGDIDGIDGGIRPLGGEGEADDAAACAYIEDGRGFGGEGEEELDQVLGLRARDEGACVAEEDAAMELDGAKEVLEGLAGGPALHQAAQGVEFAVAEGAVEFEVEIDALFAQDVGEEELGIEARTFNLVFAQVTGGGGDDFLHGFHAGTMVACGAGCNDAEFKRNDQ